MALSAIKRTDESIRISTVIEILKGMRSPSVVKHNYDQLKTFGVGKDISTNDWQDYLLQMLQMGFIEIAYNEGNKVRITDIGNDVLYGRKTAQLCVIDHSAKVTMFAVANRYVRLLNSLSGAASPLPLGSPSVCFS